MARRKQIRNPRSGKNRPSRLFDVVEDENTNDVYLEVKGKEGTKSIRWEDVVTQVDAFMEEAE